MADTAYQVMYRDEWIAGFERSQSPLRRTVTTEAMIKGRQAVFLVATSGGASAVTRGNNGLIPARLDNLTQSTVTLTESHDLSQKTGFNLFAGQSDQRAIMQAMNQKVIARAIDAKIITIMATATVAVNATASIMTKQLVNRALTTLYNNDVENDGAVYGALTPAAWAHLSDIPDFASADYVNNKPNVEGAPTTMEMKRWLGVTWYTHTGLPNAGASTAKCFIYHRNSIGHAYDSGDVQAMADYEREQDYSWSRATIYDGALLLQNEGIVYINHDDSAYSV